MNVRKEKKKTNNPKKYESQTAVLRDAHMGDSKLNQGNQEKDHPACRARASESERDKERETGEKERKK